MGFGTRSLENGVSGPYESCPNALGGLVCSPVGVPFKEPLWGNMTAMLGSFLRGTMHAPTRSSGGGKR